jgi:integrase
VTTWLDWAARHALPLSELARPAVSRSLLDQISRRLDGSPAAAATVTQKKVNLGAALSWAVEQGYLETHPFKAIRWRVPRSTQMVDRRVVVNPSQARGLLEAVNALEPSGPRLRAFFALLYYSALRPEEAANLRRRNLDLPGDGWGRIQLQIAAPEVDKQWSDRGLRREERQLKHRGVSEDRSVPMPPELVRLLLQHIKSLDVAPEDLLFRGVRGAPIASATYLRLWKEARRRALTAEQFASPLARRPYDLRHAAVSTWLNGGVPPAQVAEWAGHSVAVLLRVYAKCVDGAETYALERIAEALRRP